MKNFLRVVQVTLRRRYTFVAAVACSIGVAMFWGGNFALIKPAIEIVFTDKRPHALADQKVTEAKERLAATDADLKKLTAELAAAPADKQTELKSRQWRLTQQRQSQGWGLWATELAQPVVHRFIPNNTF